MKIPKFMSTSKVIVLIQYGLSLVVYIEADSYCGISVGNLVIMLHLRYAMMDHQRYVVLEYIFFYRVKTQDGLVNMRTFYLLLLQLMAYEFRGDYGTLFICSLDLYLQDISEMEKNAIFMGVLSEETK